MSYKELKWPISRGRNSACPLERVTYPLLTHYQDMETFGHYRRPPFLARGLRAVFGSQKIDLVHLFIYRHGARAALGGDGVNRVVFAVDRLHDGQRPVLTVGTEGQSESGIEARGIGAGANRRSGDDFPTR